MAFRQKSYRLLALSPINRIGVIGDIADNVGDSDFGG